MGDSQTENVLGLQCISREWFQWKKIPCQLQLFRGKGSDDDRGQRKIDWLNRKAKIQFILMCDTKTPLVPWQISSTIFFLRFPSKVKGWWSGKQRHSLRCLSLSTWRHKNEMSACDAWAKGSIFCSVCTNVILQANGCIQHKLDPAYMSTAEHSLTHQAHFWD